MHIMAAAFSEPGGEGWSQVAQLLLACALSTVIGMERQVRGKPAGLRTQAIVGTAAALLLLVGKYGFADVLVGGSMKLDPSRVAAQIVSGIGFLGAGLIITRNGAIKGLTTAAAVWETAAIGMAAGAGLPVLAVVVTALHFVIVLGYTPLAKRLQAAGRANARLRITYTDKHGVLRVLLSECTSRGWTVQSLSIEGAAREHGVDQLLHGERPGDVYASVNLTLGGKDIESAPAVLARIDGVRNVQQLDDETE